MVGDREGPDSQAEGRAGALPSRRERLEKEPEAYETRNGLTILTLIKSRAKRRA